ncbi:MAG: AmmeMemoRadiSam system protein B [Candidatus Aminicenantes bacterium]|nr:AmmeMemoRadiSam system protein B [Candidatus Aminicenantes bacterium]
MRRKAAVAGYFYPSGESALRDTIGRMVDCDIKKKKAFCVISPHAGFEYSGPVAGAVYSSIRLPAKFIILGPSHRHVKTRFAIMHEGLWETPFGNVPVDTDLANSVMKKSSLISEDREAHAQEHSLEVQLPFIQFFKKDISIVPISIAYLASFEELSELGRAVGNAIDETGDDVLIVASTDMSHYVEQDVAREKDFLAIERIISLDAKGLYDIVNRENISMCGYQPTAAAIVAALSLGAKQGELIKYQTSGDITGDYREVVGYAGIRIS